MGQEGEVEEVAQLLVTVPEDTVPGTVLSIPLNGGRTVRARVPEGYAPGSTLVLTKREGIDVWEVDQDAGLHTGFAQEEYSRQQADLLSPSLEDPVCHTVRLETTVGDIDIIVRLDWAPYGARRFLELASCGDLDDLAFYRSIKGCLAQFGLPTKHQWPPIPDDPPFDVPFLLGAVCFAANSPNSRKSTLFICTGDMSQWFGEEPWETPIGAVAEISLDVLDRIETAYGETAECGGPGPQVTRLIDERNGYLRREFPLLTYINRASALDWPPQVIAAPSPQSPPAVTSNALPCAVEVVGVHDASRSPQPSWPASYVAAVSSPPPQGQSPPQVVMDTELAKMEAQKAAVEAALQRARSLGSAPCAPGVSSASDTPTVIQHKPVVTPSGGSAAQASDPNQQALQAPMLLPPLQLTQMQLPQIQPLQFQANSNQVTSQPADSMQVNQSSSQQGSPTQPLIQQSGPAPAASQSQLQSSQPHPAQQGQSPAAADELSTTRASNSAASQSATLTRSLSYVPPPVAAQSGQSYSYIPHGNSPDVPFGLKPAQWISQPSGVAFGLQPASTDAYGAHSSAQPAWTSPGCLQPPSPPASMSMPCTTHHGIPPALAQEAYRPLALQPMQPGIFGMMGGGMPMPPPPISTPLAPPGSWSSAMPPMLGGPFYPFAGPALPPGPAMGPRMPMLGPMPFPSLGMP
mmetsp:Transcript_39326/g.71572  ORF Transcript_39326/g.71572 Transcript_39326/m.71572 type:complete len:690 (-) Transcript_39326:57-2126(-)